MEHQAGVLIIDDSDHWVRRFKAAVVDLAGLTVVGTAGTPHCAIRLLETLQPPIMILDLFLAGGSGIDVLKAVFSLGVRTQVVVVTGAPDAQLRASCLELGARYFFDKAFEFDKLGGALRTLLEESGTL